MLAGSEKAAEFVWVCPPPPWDLEAANDALSQP